MKLIQVAFLLLITCFSCNSNKMKQNEKELTQKILSDEEILAQKEALRLQKEKELADSLAKLPKGFRFEPFRKINQQQPPHIIDVVNNMDSIRSIKLSDIASEIEYIRMQNLPDSTISTDMYYKYYMTDKHLVATNIYGIHLFSKSGVFKNTIVRNDLSGVKYDKKKDEVLTYYSNYAKIGGHTSVWSRGNTLYYNYQNTNTGQNYIMEVDCSKNLVELKNDFDPENPHQITGLGKVAVDLNHGHNKVFKARYPNGMDIYGTENIYDKISLFSPDRNTYFSTYSKGRKNMLQILNVRGDTLASFKKLEQLKNFKHRLYRGFDFGNSYEKQGNYYFRTDYNDTVFKVIPPNIIQPEYILKLGDKKVSKQNALDPTYDLKGKIAPYEWADGKDFVFMSFIMHNNLCPNSMKDKSVKLHYALYAKKSKKLQFIKHNPTSYEMNILQNDIDGGFPVWPKSYMIDREGNIMIALRGKDIKEKVASNEFKNSPAPAGNKQKLIDLANSCSGNDQILMLVK